MDNIQTEAPPLTWRVGDVTVTRIIETHSEVELVHLFPHATREALLALPWLQPHFVTPEGLGRINMQALVVDTPTKRIIVDTCVGNDRERGPLAGSTHLQTSFLEDLEAAGFPRESFDVVLCTHLHFDHVGWNTMLVDGVWTPTFPDARYLLNRTEYEHWQGVFGEPRAEGFAEVQQLSFGDAIRPVIDAGLVDLVEGRHRVCPEVELVPTVGHSPGHVSVRIASQGQEALITGDMSHHPCQLAHVDWGLVGVDYDAAQATATRRRVFSELADGPVLVIGTHWAGASAGRIKRAGAAYCLEC